MPTATASIDRPALSTCLNVFDLFDKSSNGFRTRRAHARGDKQLRQSKAGDVPSAIGEIGVDVGAGSLVGQIADVGVEPMRLPLLRDLLHPRPQVPGPTGQVVNCKPAAMRAESSDVIDQALLCLTCEIPDKESLGDPSRRLVEVKSRTLQRCSPISAKVNANTAQIGGWHRAQRTQRRALEFDDFR